MKRNLFSGFLGFSPSDKKIEYQRYNNRAKYQSENKVYTGLNSLCLTLRSPYLYYESLMRKFLNENHKVLEVGCGTGNHTFSLIASNANVTATDISEESLSFLSDRYNEYANIKVLKCDIENIPFPDNSFDFVFCAGSLSYGDKFTIMNEIYRVLKFNGSFISVDSLNHNPIYVLNRYFHYLKGNRTFSTLINMPSIQLLNSYNKLFGKTNIRYFGLISWLMPFLSVVLGKRLATIISDYVDDIFKVRYNAYKYVMIATKVLKYE